MLLLFVLSVPIFSQSLANRHQNAHMLSYRSMRNLQGSESVKPIEQSGGQGGKVAAAKIPGAEGNSKKRQRFSVTCQYCTLQARG